MSWMFVHLGVDLGMGVLTGAAEHGSTVRQKHSREQLFGTSFACWVKAIKPNAQAQILNSPGWTKLHTSALPAVARCRAVRPSNLGKREPNLWITRPDSDLGFSV